MRSLWLTSVFLASLTEGQFEQRWHWQSIGTPLVPKPFWRREGHLPYREVLFPPDDVILEYNCAKMPSICKNVANWHADASKQWVGKWDGYFTYDFGTSLQQTLPAFQLARRRPAGTTKTVSNWRRENCPDNWKGTAANPKCPERDQPDIYPPWRDSITGANLGAIETIDPFSGSFSLEIEAGRLSPNDPHPVRSGMKYSCDEFPPAAWIEGGVGTPGVGTPEGDGTDGNTYCAPIADGCGGTGTGTASEQNWQGTIHGKLKSILRKKIKALRGTSPQSDEAVAFQFRTATHVTQGHAARVYFRLGNNNVAVGSPSSGGSGTIIVPRAGPTPATGQHDRVLRRQIPHANATAMEKLEFGKGLSIADYADMGWISVDLMIDDSVPGQVTATFKMPDGEVIPAEQTTAMMRALDTFILPASNTSAIPDYISPSAMFTAEFSTDGSVQKSSDPAPWNISATDVEGMSTTYGLMTQQEPGKDRIDIIALSREYILAQIGQSNSTGNHSIQTEIKAHKDPTSGSTFGRLLRHRRSQEQAESAISPFSPLLNRAVEGPIQCGPGNPCKDESCCNKDGKCGYKKANCGDDFCISHCEAKAMCGMDSADGKTACGLKLCCSFYGWCGTEDVHCYDPEPDKGLTPCQIGFGSCEITPDPVCGKESNLASKGRRVGYYQGWNGRDRACDKVSPRQINTRGLTHLFYSFISFHPDSFEVMPMNDLDIPLYGEFTSLQRNGLQTWVAVGGWSFNEPGPTEQAYSNMVSTKANRKAFIRSLIKFMDLYGFQGADLDWEYPSEPKRGGRTGDAENLVLLVKEMKEQFGGRFGISLTLAPDYWYLRGFKPAAMQEHVDFMGFMAYDLHGPWDTDVRTLGSIVRPQTDITEIDKNLKPLWFDGVDPSKINLGLAYYGRTYKLTDPACGRMGCSFISGEGGAVGSCTNTAGVLSNREIRRMIDEEKIQPYFNETAMVKYFTYAGNSWVGYDDAETYALKEAFANDRCLGGIMIWSVDFDDETGIGLNPTNEFKSPESATIIPMAHTTVKPGQTFTLGPGASTDLPRLPNGGDQNVPAGPGGDQCNQCSFFRLITSTCCGSGGSVGNPILIPAGNPTPMDIPLPAGFTPNEEFKDPDGNNIPANKPLPKETILPQGTTFTKPFVIAPGEELKNGEGDETNGTNLIWLSPEVWNTDPPDVQCNFPCTFVFPPYPKYTTTLDYPRVTITESGTVKTTRTFPPLTISLFPMSTMVVSGRDECTDTSTNCEEAAGRTRTSIPEFSTTTTWPPVTWTSTGRLSSYTPPPGTRGPDDPKNPSVKPPCLFCPPGPPHIKLPGIHIHPGTPKPTTKPCSYPGPTCPYPGPPGPPGTNPPGTGPPGTSVPPGGDPDEEEGEEEEEQEDEEESLCLINPSEPEEPDDPDQPTAAPTTPKTSSPTPSPTPSPPTNNFKPECSGSVEAPDIVKSFRDDIKTMCKDHKKLQDGAYIRDGKGGLQWDEGVNVVPGVTWAMVWNTEGHDSCPFDCETVFNAFADSKACLKDGGTSKSGFIQTDCGRASMSVFKR